MAADGEAGDNGRPEVRRLLRRVDFLRVAKGRKWHTTAFSLQAGDAGPGAGVRIGFTVTKKVGNAVERNRVRRRLKEAVRLSPALAAEPGRDYVLVARRDVLATAFPDLLAALETAFRAIHGKSRRRRPHEPSGRTRGEAQAT